MSLVKTTYGSAPADIPAGFSHRIIFPELCRLDESTPDGRTIGSSGFGAPYLPATIKFLDVQGPGGHEMARAAGVLHEVTVHEDGLVSGIGFAADVGAGPAMVEALRRRMVKGNSVDLRDVSASVKFPDFADMTPGKDGWMSIPKMQVRFDAARIGATTVCMEPAFGHACAVLEDGDTITASFGWWGAEAETPEVDEVTAAAKAALPKWDDFYVPEPDKPQPLFVDEDGVVTAHLGLWDSCHDGFTDRCVRIPRSPDGYSTWQKPGVLTDQGMVPTGPIFLFNGHPRIAKGEDVEAAYGGVENAWADVRIVDGRFGPWMSGRVRPGVDPDLVYAARASKISGHWLRGNLKAIVSVNAEGFNVPYQFTLDGSGEVEQLVASFGTGHCGECGEGSADEAPGNVMLRWQLALLADG